MPPLTQALSAAYLSAADTARVVRLADESIRTQGTESAAKLEQFRGRDLWGVRHPTSGLPLLHHAAARGSVALVHQLLDFALAADIGVGSRVRVLDRKHGRGGGAATAAAAAAAAAGASPGSKGVVTAVLSTNQLQVRLLRNSANGKFVQPLARDAAEAANVRSPTI